MQVVPDPAIYCAVSARLSTVPCQTRSCIYCAAPSTELGQTRPCAKPDQATHYAVPDQATDCAVPDLVTYCALPAQATCYAVPDQARSSTVPDRATYCAVTEQAMSLLGQTRPRTVPRQTWQCTALCQTRQRPALCHTRQYTELCVPDQAMSPAGPDRTVLCQTRPHPPQISARILSHTLCPNHGDPMACPNFSCPTHGGPVRPCLHSPRPPTGPSGCLPLVQAISRRPLAHRWPRLWVWSIQKSRVDFPPRSLPAE